MSLLVFSKKNDYSMDIVEEQSISRKIQLKRYYFEDITFAKGVIYHQDKQLIIPKDKNTKIILRSDSSYKLMNINYWIFTKYIIQNHYSQILLDGKCIKEFHPYFDDKLYVAMLFQKLKVPQPNSYYIPCIDGNKLPSFPFLLKQRYGARASGNFMIKNLVDLKSYEKKYGLDSFIIQELIDAKEDYRLIILKNKYIGCALRSAKFSISGDIGKCKVIGKKIQINPEIISDSFKIAKKLNTDLIGIDVLVDKKGQHYFIEPNVSPQFRAFAEATKIDVASKILDLV